MKPLRPRSGAWEKVKNPDRVSKIVILMAGIYAMCVSIACMMFYVFIAWIASLQWTIEGAILVMVFGGLIGMSIGGYLTMSTIHAALRMPDENSLDR